MASLNKGLCMRYLLKKNVITQASRYLGTSFVPPKTFGAPPRTPGIPQQENAENKERIPSLKEGVPAAQKEIPQGKESNSQHQSRHPSRVRAPRRKTSSRTVVHPSGAKHVFLAGQSNKLMDFATQDLIGSKNDPDLIEEEVTALSKYGLSGQYQQEQDGEVLHASLKSKLASVHRKRQTALVSGSFSASIESWVQKLSQNDSVFIDSKLDMQCNSSANMMHYNNLQELSQKFKTVTETGKRFILISIGSSAEDILLVKSTMSLAERHKAVVVLCDPLGVILMRTIIGDFQDNLDILRKPLIIHSSLNSFSGLHSMSYVCGPSGFIDWYQQTLNEAQKMKPAYLTAKINKILTTSDEMAGKLCQSLFNSIHLKRKLTEAGVQVKCDALSLYIGIKDNSSLHTVRERLKNEGFHVGLVQQADRTGLQINVSPNHSTKDLQRLTSAIEMATKSRDHLTSKSTNQSQASMTSLGQGHAISFPIEVLRQQGFEKSSERVSDSGEGILRDFDLAVPIQANIAEYGLMAAATMCTSPEQDAAISRVNAKFNQKDMKLLESVFFSHLEDNKD